MDGRGNVTVMLNDGTEVTQTRPGEGLSYKVITNEKLPLKLSILKVDSQDAEVTLAGAQFVMKKESGIRTKRCSMRTARLHRTAALPIHPV